MIEGEEIQVMGGVSGCMLITLPFLYRWESRGSITPPTLILKHTMQVYTANIVGHEAHTYCSCV